tara:strand:- start:837 stop:1136 length:300 start_codon:yes stop_codon:yes gene_type:complete
MSEYDKLNKLVTDISTHNLKSGDLLVLKIKRDNAAAIDKCMHQMVSFSEMLKEKHEVDVPVLIITDEMDIETITKESLEKMGYYRMSEDTNEVTENYKS